MITYLASCLAITAAYSVTVGMQQTAYTVTEVDEYQLVCFEVLAGDVEGREIVIDYSTTSGTASKLSIVTTHFLRMLCIHMYDFDTLIPNNHK